MKTRYKILPVLGVILIFAVAGYVLRTHGLSISARSGARKVQFYQDSMHPWVKSDRPGKCTICNMDLTPIYEGQQSLGGDENVLVLSSKNLAVLNVQTEEVRQRPLRRTLRATGILEANEARKAVLSAPASGRVVSLRVDFAGAEVQARQPLVTLMSPELFHRQGWLRATHTVNTADSSDSTTSDSFSSILYAPHAGTVTERAVVPGQYVAEGEKLLTIIDPSVMWFRFDVYQRDLPYCETGQTLDVTVEGMPGRTFPAVISIIEPTVNDATRTVKVRADIQNPAVKSSGQTRRLLRFGMYAEGRLRAALDKALAVPRSAILFPGATAYAYVDKGGGAYERRRVKLGRQSDEYWEILKGLKEGERVVSSGNVLIDAQAEFNRSTEDAGEAEETDASEEHAKAAHGPHASAAEPDKELRTGTAIQLGHEQQEKLEKFLESANSVSAALAADNLTQFNQGFEKVKHAVPEMQKEFPASHPWAGSIKALANLEWSRAASLEDARKQFLPFSTATVELTKQVRKEDPAFAGLKIYHCPMAPKPGLWIQAKGPLANPFYGAEMLRCGSEVKP